MGGTLAEVAAVQMELSTGAHTCGPSSMVTLGTWVFHRAALKPQISILAKEIETA